MTMSSTAEEASYMSERDEGEEKNLKERKVPWKMLRRGDSLNLEAGKVTSFRDHAAKINWKTKLRLAFGSIGVVYRFLDGIY
ncbi:hypothetical protein AB3S75_040047 [Citrus x aurantiifolia]